jgi:hypothetical protein
MSNEGSEMDASPDAEPRIEVMIRLNIFVTPSISMVRRSALSFHGAVAICGAIAAAVVKRIPQSSHPSSKSSRYCCLERCR